MTVILNHASGGAEREQMRARTIELLRARDDGTRILPVPAGSGTTALARRAVAEGERLVVAAGGDGTVSGVAAAVSGTEAAMGVLPLGTLNHFARDAGVPLKLEAAVETLFSGRIMPVDVGEVNGRVFVNNSSLGLYARMVARRVIQQRRGRSKWAALLWSSFYVLRRFPFLNVRLNADGRQIQRSTPFVFIGNNEYEVEGFELGRRLQLDAGSLWLYVTPDRASRSGLMRFALRAISGTLRQDRDFCPLPVRELCVETRRRRVPVACDGEVMLMRTPLRYRILPRSLRIVVPAR